MLIESFLKFVEKKRIISTNIYKIVESSIPVESDIEESFDWLLISLVDSGYIAEHTFNALWDEFFQKHDDKNFRSNNDHVVGEKFGNYLLYEQIGYGGMSKVYRAFDPKLQREIALKIIIRDDKNTELFLREVQLIAQLSHPNIIQIYDFGEKGKFSYYTMPYIKGEPLNAAIKNGIPLDVALTIFSQITQAVSFIHQREIIHRDIKPENIILNKKNQPVLLDFGLAKKTETQVSQTGVITGTVSYMSPEQAQGKTGITHFKSDIFSLGIVLYEILTGRNPFLAESLPQTIAKIVHFEPPSPRFIQPEIDIDLDTICMKCLEKNIYFRYENMEQLSEDLRRYQNNEVILAKPTNIWRKSYKWLQRHKFLSMTIIAVFSTFLLYIFSLHSFSQQRARETQITRMRLAKIAAAQAERAYMNNQWQQGGVLSGVAIQYTQGIDSSEATDIVKNSRDIIRLCLEKHSLLWQKKYQNRWVIPNPKGQLVCHIRKRIEVYDLSSNKLLLSCPRPTHINIDKLCFSPNQKLLAIMFPGKIAIWSIEKQLLIVEIKIQPMTLPTHQMCFTNNATNFAFTAHDQSVHLWNLTSKKLDKIFPAVNASPNDSANCLGFSKDCALLAHSFNHLFVLRDMQTQKVIHTFEGHRGYIYQLLFSKKQQVVISRSADNTVRVWSLHTKKQRYVLELRDKPILNIALSHNEELLAIGYQDGRIGIWDLEFGRLIHIFDTTANGYHIITFSDDDQILTVSGEKTLEQWRIFYRHRKYSIEVPKKDIKLESDYHGKIFASHYKECLDVDLWETNSGNSRGTLQHSHYVREICFSKNDTLAVSCTDNQIHLWNIATKTLRQSFTTPNDSFTMKFSIEQPHILAYACESNIFIYDTDNKIILKELRHSQKVTSIDFSEHFLAVCTGKSVTLYDTRTYQKRKYIAPKDFVNRYRQNDFYVIKLDKTGAFFCVAAVYDIYIWDIQNHQVKKHLVEFSDMAFIPHLNSFYIGDRVFDSATGRIRKIVKQGWMRTSDIVYSEQGICLYADRKIYVTQMSLLPQHSYQRLPLWCKEFPESHNTHKNSSTLYLHQDVPSWFIDAALREAPQKLVEKLFQLRVGENLLTTQKNDE